MEKLKVRVTEATLQDFAELDDQNLKQVVLRWQFGPSIESILPELKRLKNLQRLTLDKLSVPSFEMLCDFIMAMKHLKYLFLVFIRHGSNRDKLIPLREKITQFVSSRRPGFEFLIC